MCIQATHKQIGQYISFVEKHISISMTDANGLITCASDAFCKMTGYTKEELLGKTHALLRHPDTQKSIYTDMWKTIAQGNIWHGRLKNRTKNDQTYWVEEFIQPLFSCEKITGYIAIRKNVTEELTYEKLAKADPLTGLLNRYAIEEFLRLFIQEAKRYKTPLCIMMIDIDNFKETNDIYGHLAGDRVLKGLSSLFQQMIRESDRIGRWGGEEFMILLPHTTYQQAFELAQRLCKEFSSYPFDSVGHKTASFGVAAYKEGDSLVSLTDKVDKALYSAKRNGKNRVS
jgi:diguanylate cyclase (GGDEF)-like protein/PAS domain S-box-containing protein